MTNPLLLELRCGSSSDWLTCVMEHFDQFLADHAANERKASSMALSMVAHYPDRPELVTAMVDLALEELGHFRQVVQFMTQRELILGPDHKDPYVNQIRAHFNRGPDQYFLDRLLSAAVIEARGTERFAMVASALDDTRLSRFYAALSRSEKTHQQLFVQLALGYFEREQVETRLDEWLNIEAVILNSLTVEPRLH